MSENITPRPLERRVGRVDNERFLDMNRFCFLFLRLTANAAKFLKSLPEKLPTFIGVAITRHTIHNKKVWIILISSCVFVPSFVQCSSFFFTQMQPELSDSSFVLSVCSFYPLTTSETASSNAGQSIYKDIASCRILNKIAVKGIPVSDSGLELGVKSGNTHSGTIANYTPHSGGNSSTQELGQVKDTSIWHNQTFVDFYSWVLGALVGYAFIWWILPWIDMGKEYSPWPIGEDCEPIWLTRLWKKPPNAPVQPPARKEPE